MDIAFIARRYDRVGGTEIDLYHLTELLAGFGHKVTIYCQQIKVPPAPGVSMKKVPSLGFGRITQMLSLAYLGPRLAYSGGHDIVIGFTRVLKQDLVRCGGGTHKLFIEKMKSSEGRIKRLLRSLSIYHNALIAVEKKQFQRGSRKVLAISNIVKHEIMTTYKVPEERIEVIYDGIDTELFSPRNMERYRKEIRDQYSIPSDAFVILFLGSGYKRKNLSTLLEAIPQIESNNIYCLVVGGDKNPEYYAAKASSLGIENRVVFAGVQREAQKFYAAADVFAIPSLQEAFGNVVLEAMASGLPAVTTSLSGASEIMEGNLKSLILNNPLDTRGLANIISKLTEESLRKKLAREAREIAKSYTLERNAKAIEALCYKTIEEKIND